MKAALAIYLAALVLMTFGMIAVTHRLLSVEHNEQLQALKGENERLALWRMESQLLSLMLRESGRHYGDELVLHTSLQPFPQEVICFFQRMGPQRTTNFIWKLNDSTQMTTDQVEALAESEATNHLQQASVPQSSPWVDHIKRTTFSLDFIQALGEPLPTTALQVQSPFAQQAAKSIDRDEWQQGASKQMARSQSEFNSRTMNSITYLEPREAIPLRAFWLNDQLFLARWTGDGRQSSFEGCVLDWEVMHSSLLAPIRDLLPNANLVPLAAGETGDHHALANLPLKLIPGDLDSVDLQVSSTLKPTLFVAWSCLAASAIALGILLLGVIRLSERRAAFVSAVTHELRTPLTTFRLYSDLLATSGALSKEKYDRYVETLKAEAERLQYLIENVLDWSRLERSAKTERLESIDWLELWQRIAPSLKDRAAQAGMSLECIYSPTDRVTFNGNRTAVERILFNLVDNACKYAKSSTDKRIHIEVQTSDGKWLSVIVSDHGPGITTEMRRQLFQPFSKSAQQAARSAPGIGLGLSLSRRLARDMRGDLLLKNSSVNGAVFQLLLRT